MKSIIPPHAQKVFEGIIFDIYQWQQELFDGTKTTFEIATRPGIVSIIATQNNKIYIAKEEQPSRAPYVTIPSGFSEKYDIDALETAKRELREETGLTGTDWELFISNDIHPRMSVDDHVYILRNATQTEEKQLDAGERTLEERWVTLDEFIALSEGELFVGPGLTYHLLRAKHEPEYKDVLKQKFFGNQSID